jgi:hypothetical protein
MAKQSRESSLTALMQQHRDTQTPESTAATPVSERLIPKSEDPTFIKLTAYVPRALHARFKAKAALQQRQISEIIVEFAERFVGEEGEGK